MSKQKKPTDDTAANKAAQVSESKAGELNEAMPKKNATLDHNSNSGAGNNANKAKGDSTPDAANKKSNATETTTAGANKAVKTDKKKPASQKTATNNSTGMRRIILMLLTAILLSGIFGYGFYHNHEHWRIAKQSDDAQAMNHDSLSDEMDELKARLNDESQQNQRLLAELKTNAQERQAIQNAIGKLSEQLAKKGRGPLKWRLAEVDYLLEIANHRVIFERDVKTAAKALSDADQRLVSISDPALVPIRQKIAGEIIALESVDLPDIASLAIKLNGLVINIERLPLINKDRIFDRNEIKNAPVDDWRELPKAMWNDIKTLVTIRRTQEPVDRLLPPDEMHYLYQNLGLKLEEARIALLQQNTNIFRQHLSDTQSWLQKYFDPDSAAVITVVTTLGEMSSLDLKPALPDVSGSLRALREWVTIYEQRATNTMQRREHIAGAEGVTL